MAFDAIFLFDIAIILFFAKVLGEVAERFRMPPIAGELLAGLILGPLLLVVRPNDFLGQMANLGMLFIAFLIGLAVKFDETRKDATDGAIIALVISAVSFAAGAFVGAFFFHSLVAGLFIGAAMMVSSTSIGTKFLIDSGDIKSRVHDIVITANKAGDIIAIIAVTAVFGYAASGILVMHEIVILAVVVMVISAALLVFGAKHIGAAFSRITILKDENITLSIPLSIIFVMSFVFESFGISSIVGAFLVGLALSRSSITESSIIPKMKILTYGFFAPFFFAYSAILLDISVFFEAVPALVTFVVLMAAATFAASFVAGRRYGFAGIDALKIGAAKLPRGEFSVIIAHIGLAGMITSPSYSFVILTVLATAIITPILMKVLYRR